jgi:hypothetical protein
MKPEIQALIDEINLLPGWKAELREDLHSVLVSLAETRGDAVKQCDTAIDEDGFVGGWTIYKAMMQQAMQEAFETE